jgi:hypothetical protein
VSNLWTVATVIYGLGVITALIGTDARPVGRLGLALVWPLGPLAALATILVLLATAAVAFPLFGVLMLGAALAAWWSFG